MEESRAASAGPRAAWQTPRHQFRVRCATVTVLLLFAGCYLRGPAPTKELVESPLGPFAYGTLVVPSTVEGFGGGTIYHPTGVVGTLGAVAVVPGFGADQSYVDWYGPRLSSHGFVVFIIDTNSVWDIPDQRGEQLIAALDYLTSESQVSDLVDADRLAVMGWSFGGGGAIYATDLRPDLKAAIPLAMWFWDNDRSKQTVPTLLVSCENDDLDNEAHTNAVYASLPESTPKAMLEIAGADHQCVASVGPTEGQRATIARMVISFLKIHVDGDLRYLEFACPEPANPDVSKFECANVRGQTAAP